MPKTVEVQGVEIEFPDEMGESQIADAIDRNLPDIFPDILRDPAIKEEWSRRQTWREQSAVGKLEHDIGRGASAAGMGVGNIFKGSGVLLDMLGPSALAQEGHFDEAERMRNRTSDKKIADIRSSPVTQFGQRIEDATQKAFPNSQPQSASRPLGAIAEGVGSTASFLPAGMAGPVGVAIAGALQAGGSAYEEAVNKGASQDNAEAAFFFNALGGTTEALPISRIFERINKASGGAMFKAIRNVAASGFEEGFQEVSQKTLENVVAKHLYDDERGYLQGVADSGGMGASTGILLSAFGIGSRRLAKSVSDRYQGGQRQPPAKPAGPVPPTNSDTAGSQTAPAPQPTQPTVTSVAPMPEGFTELPAEQQPEAKAKVDVTKDLLADIKAALVQNQVREKPAEAGRAKTETQPAPAKPLDHGNIPTTPPRLGGDIEVSVNTQNPESVLQSTQQQMQRQVSTVAATEGRRDAKEVKTELVQRLEMALEESRKDGKKPANIRINIPGDGDFQIVNEPEKISQVLMNAKKLKTESTAKKASVPGKVSHDAETKNIIDAYGSAEAAYQSAVRQRDALPDNDPETPAQVDRANILIEQLYGATKLGIAESQAEPIRKTVATMEEGAVELRENIEKLKSSKKLSLSSEIKLNQSEMIYATKQKLIADYKARLEKLEQTAANERASAQWRTAAALTPPTAAPNRQQATGNPAEVRGRIKQVRDARDKLNAQLDAMSASNPHRKVLWAEAADLNKELRLLRLDASQAEEAAARDKGSLKTDDAGQANEQRATQPNPTQNARSEQDARILADIAAQTGDPRFGQLLPVHDAAQRGEHPIQAGQRDAGLGGAGAQAGLAELERVFNVRIILVRMADGSLTFFNGVRPIPGRRVILISADADHPHMVVAGHEIGHVMKDHHPDLYREMRAALEQWMQNVDLYRARLNALERQAGISGSDTDRATDDLVNDFIGDNLGRAEFWRRLAKEEPGLFKRAVRVVLRWLDDTLKRWGAEGLPKNYGADQYFTDLKAARDIVAETLKQYAGTVQAEQAARMAQAGKVTEAREGSEVRQGVKDFSLKQSQGGEFSFESPESVAEQKARMAGEAATQKRKEQAEEMRRRLQAPLTGSGGDLGQRDMFGGGELFSLKRESYTKGVLARSVSAMVHGDALPKAFREARQWGLGFQKYIEESLRLLTLDARKALQAEFKTAEDLHWAEDRLLAYWTGEAELNTVGGPALQRAAEAFRQTIDELTTMAVTNGLVPREKSETWLENRGGWLKRTYLAFDPTADWNYDALRRRAEKGDKEIRRIWEGITGYLRSQNPKITGGELEAIMRKMVDRREVEDILGIGSQPMAGSGKPFSVDIGSLLRRKDLPVEVRDWMGQIADPFARGLQSGKWMAQFITRNLVQRKFANLGMQMGLLSDTPKGREWVELYPNESQLVQARDDEGNPLTTEDGKVIAEHRQRVDRRHEPLHGFHTTPEFAAALEEFDGKMNQQRTIADVLTGIGMLYLKGVGYIKAAKVGLNPYSYMLNTIGGVAMRLGAGGFNPVHFKDALMAVSHGNGPIDLNATATHVRNRANYLLATKAGVTGRGVLLGDVRTNLQRDTEPEAVKRAMAALRSVLNDPKGGGAWVRLRDAMSDIMQMPGDYGIKFMDDVFRVSAFLDELALARKAYPEWTQEKQMEWAADRASNLYQTYDRLLPILRGFSRSGVLATFISFKLELFRNAYWTARYAAQGIKSDNPAMRKDGYQKAVGLMAMTLAPYALAALSRAKWDTDDEDVEALQRWVVPPWDRGEELVIAGRKGNTWRYVPMGYILPYYELTRAINMGFKAADDPNPDQAITRALRGMATDYFGPGAFAGPAIETIGNFRLGGGQLTKAEGVQGAKDRLSYLRRAWSPNIGDPLFQAYAGMTDKEGNYGRKYDLTEVGMKLGGIRVRTVDIEKQLTFSMQEFSDRWRNVSGYASMAERKYHGDEGKRQDAKDYKTDTQANLKRQYRQFHADMLRLGIQEGAFRRSEKETNLPADLSRGRH